MNESKQVTNKSGGRHFAAKIARSIGSADVFRRFSLLVIILFGVSIFVSLYATFSIEPSHARADSKLNGEFSSINRALRSDKIWDGADGAMTIDLNSGKTLWLFGDTWIKNAGKRQMINNSVALQNGSRWEFGFKGDAKHPKSLFVPENKESWYWPGCGTEYNGKLYLILKKIVQQKNKDPLFQFDWMGEDLVVVSNPQDPPSKWISVNMPMSNYLHQIQHGLACMKDEDYLYSLCFFEKMPGEKKKTLIARLSLKELKKAQKKHWRFWSRYHAEKESGGTKGGDWLEDYNFADNIIPDCGPEASLFFDKGFGCFMVVYQPPFSNAVKIRVSRKIEGPWSDSIAIYTVPEIKLKNRKGKALVYAGKAHESLSQDHRIGFTYCANPGDIRAHELNRDIYFPTARYATVTESRIRKLLDTAGVAAPKH